MLLFFYLVLHLINHIPQSTCIVSRGLRKEIAKMAAVTYTKWGAKKKKKCLWENVLFMRLEHLILFVLQRNPPPHSLWHLPPRHLSQCREELISLGEIREGGLSCLSPTLRRALLYLGSLMGDGMGLTPKELHRYRE